MRRMDRYKEETHSRVTRMDKNQELYQNLSSNTIYTNITDVTNANALATLIIGMGVHPYPYTLDGVKWGEHDHYLQIDIDPTDTEALQKILTPTIYTYDDKPLEP